MGFLNLSIVVVFLAFLAKFHFNEFELSWVYPYALLFTPFRNQTLDAWKQYSNVKNNIYRQPIHIPEIFAADYNYEVLRTATNNFRHPAVVRGLFNDTTALKKWGSVDYLPSVLGEFTIPAVRNAQVGTLQDNRFEVNFGEAFTEMWESESSGQYLFFPVKSRFTFNGSTSGTSVSLQQVIDDLVQQDLDLNRIWPGFGSASHSTYHSAQFVIGKSLPQSSGKATGSDWHCAIGNNWFVQTAGRKRWQFVDPEHSAYMHPLKGGFFNMWTGNKQQKDLEKHIETRYVDLNAGDLLYNPDWQWHKVTNYDGLSIGVPIRELNFTLSFQNNPYFSSIVITNKILSYFVDWVNIGGFPPPHAGTEGDNF